jgi:hypothetical protein
MGFGTALHYMHDGVIVRRKTWPTSYAISVRDGKIINLLNGKPATISLSIETRDILARDWEIGPAAKDVRDAAEAAERIAQEENVNED